MTGLPFASTRGAASGEDLTMTQEATGRRDAVSGGSSKMNLRRVGTRSEERERDALCGVVVVGLDLFELEVEEVLRVEGALVGDLGLRGGGLCAVAAAEVDVPGETNGACGRVRSGRVSGGEAYLRRGG